MIQLQKFLYTAKAQTTSGREGGASRASDGHLDVRLSPPGASGTGANPEQLFAAGWSACFLSAITIATRGTSTSQSTSCKPHSAAELRWSCFPAMEEPQSMPVNEAAKNHNATSADLMTMAERELGAFISAVTELYGSEQAKLSADDWLDELESMDSLSASTTREWRMVTIAAAARLANRIIGVGR